MGVNLIVHLGITNLGKTNVFENDGLIKLSDVFCELGVSAGDKGLVLTASSMN